MVKIKNADSISDIPAAELVPWTEAVRISGTGLMYERPMFLVNKTGVFSFFTPNSYNSDEDIIQYFPEENLNLSCEGFYRTDAGILVRFYQNTIFSTEEKRLGAPFLCRYEPIAKEILPVISYADFNLPFYAQLVNLHYSGKWFACFKMERENSVEFKYFAFTDIKDINIGLKEISAEAFMKNTAPIIINEAFFKSTKNETENNFLNLLKDVEEKSIKISYSGAVSKSVKTYIKNDSEYIEDTEHEAFGIRTKGSVSGRIYEALLLDNGKLYAKIAGVEKTLIKKMPELPEKFVYTYFAPYEDFILAAWEEQDFFRVGRSGFLLFKWNIKD